MSETEQKTETKLIRYPTYDFDNCPTRAVRTVKIFGVSLDLPIPKDTGREPAIDETILSRLTEAFAIGCTDEEACFYAGISPSTLYRYQENNDIFRELKEYLKLNPILKARVTLYKSLDDPNFAWKFLQRKSPDLQDTDKPTVQLAVQVNNIVEKDREKYK